MCLFIADDGSGLELCLRDDVVGVSDWACVVCILCGGGGGGGEVTVSMCSLVLLGCRAQRKRMPSRWYWWGVG